MAEPRKGRQTPTQSVVLPYFVTKSQESVDLYNNSEDSVPFRFLKQRTRKVLLKLPEILHSFGWYGDIVRIRICPFTSRKR